MVRLRLTVLGAPQIERNDTPVSVDTRKAIALLSYLALTGERYRRDALANLLWPELDRSHGLAALRRTLYTLREALGGECLDADRSTIELRPDADLWIDVDQFRSYLAQCASHDHPASEVCPACLPMLNAAAELYRGDFLEGFSLRDSVNFDDWQYYQADALRREFIDVLARLVRGHVAQGEYKPALWYARRWLAVDHLDERAHVELMRLYAWTGQRSAALRQYEECTEILEDQFGAAPQSSTQTLHEAIRDGHPPSPPTDPALVSERKLSPGSSNSFSSRRQTPAKSEKLWVTAFIVDVSRSFQQMDSLTADQDVSLMRRFRQKIGDVIARYGGRIERTLSRRTLIIFGTHESDPEVAIRAALEMRRAVRALGLRVAVGIDTGEVYPDRSPAEKDHNFSSLGPTVDLATSLALEAGPDQILVGETTHHLTRAIFAFTAVILSSKALNEPVTAYQVNRILAQPRKAPGIKGIRPELVDRYEELTTLRKALDRVSNGKGQIVSLIGEAGVGKSRLITELRERAMSAGDERKVPLWFEGRCLDVGTPPSYAPFLDILSQYFAWTVEDNEEARCRRINTVLQEMIDQGSLPQQRADEMDERLCKLLIATKRGEVDMLRTEENPERMRERTFRAIRDLVVALTRQYDPLVLVFEDLHWADALSLDLIAFLMESLAELPLYLLCVYRPIQGHKCTHLGTVATRKCGDCYTEIRLRELTEQQSQYLAASILDSDALPSPVNHLILRRAQGNPFYIEEVIRSLIDAGIVYHDGNTWLAREGITKLSVPDSAQGVILSRLERLPHELRRLLRLASVIGRVFSQRLLVSILGPGVALKKMLWELEDLDLIYQERVVPAVEYSFKHALTKEAIYHNILRSHRTILHRQVAKAMEALHMDNLDNVCEQLAYHYDRGDDAERATTFLLRAGRKAQRNAANEAAIRHLRRGLALLEDISETSDRERRELDLLISLGVSLVLIKGHGASEVEAAYARARELCVRACEPLDRFQILMGLRRFYLFRGELRTAHELGAQFLALAKEMDDAGTLARAHFMHGETYYWLGEFSRARKHYIKGLAHYDPGHHRNHTVLYGNDTKLGCLIFQALTSWHLGFPDQALATADKALALAHNLSQPFNLTFAPFFAAMLHQLRREDAAALELANAVIRQAQEHGFSLFVTMSSMVRGWALVMGGQSDAGFALMSRTYPTFEETDIKGTRSFFLALQVDALLETGSIDRGLQLVNDALALIEKSEERCWEAELHRLRGELLSAQGQTSKAEMDFKHAIDVAQHQEARSWELRAVISMARLWQQRDRVREAEKLLRDVYGKFSEGFDTKDLEEAKALLDALA